MEGLWWIGNEKSLTFRKDITEPQIEDPDDVKIKIAFSGICGSDLHYMSGTMGKMATKPDGVIMGHEYSGTVMEVGKEGKFEVGDRVCIQPGECCGNCSWNEESKPHFCSKQIQHGLRINGGWAQYCVVKDWMVHKLPEKVSLQQGALGEPYACVLRGWRRLDPLPPRESRILVQGAGIIGILFCSLLHLNGYKNVTVSEINESRRKLCRGMNLQNDVVDPQEIDLMFSKKEVDIDGFHVVIDCTGNTSAVKKAFELARRGAKVLIFGCCRAGDTIPFEPYQLYWKELTVLGSFIYPFCFGDTMGLLEKLASRDYLDYEKLGIKTFDLHQYEEALDSLKKGEASKAIFKFGH